MGKLFKNENNSGSCLRIIIENIAKIMKIQNQQQIYTIFYKIATTLKYERH